MMGSKHTKPCEFLHERYAYLGHIYEVPILRKLMYITVIILVVLEVLAITNFIIPWNPSLLIQHGYLILIFIFVIVVNIGILSTIDNHFPIMKLKEKMWKVNEAGPKLSKIIDEDIESCRRQRISSTILSLLVSYFTIPITGDWKKLYRIMYFLKDFDDNAIFTTFFVVWTLYGKFIVAMLYPIPNFILLHGVGDIIYNSMMIKEKLQLIEKTFGTEDRWYYDAGYQNYANYMRQLVHRILIPGSSAGILLSALFYLCMTMEATYLTIIKSSGILILNIFFLYQYCKAGQKVEDQGEQLHRELCNCPWYLWNKSNKTLYLFFLMHTREPTIFESVTFKMNYTLMVSYFKNSMSLITAIRKLTE